MITFDKLGAYGRLGNQLFQYAALTALSLKRGYEFKIPPQANMKWHGQDSLMQEFNITAKEYTQEEYNTINKKYIEPTWRTIDENFFNLPDNTNIEGFFQTIWYFDEFAEEIKKELTPKDKYIVDAKKYIQDIKDKYPDHEVVSLHIRRGNVVEDASMKDSFIKYYEVGGAYFKYLEEAKEVYNGMKVKYLVFSGGAKWDENNETEIDWCKKHLIGDEYIFSEQGLPMEDFTRIMVSDHSIISPSSSYGWWAAYLNTNADKIIVAPKSYLVPEPEYRKHMFYPSDYILL